uniref:Uncharacterized protein n=1 Tax=viral metagenome TaxID=1070528 RepID=A0A6M3KBK3_9ZZZZ
MSAYKLVFLEAITALGLKKALSEFLLSGKVVDEKTVGQFTANINSGGVTDAFINKKIVG